MIRSGLRVVFDGEVPLGGARTPGESLRSISPRRLPATSSCRRCSARGAPLSIADFFDRNGYSRVAGKAALAPAGGAPDSPWPERPAPAPLPSSCTTHAVPGGLLGADERIGVPVVSVPAGAAGEALRLLRAGEPATIEIGAPRERENPFAGGPAAFSSHGLAFDGGTKPEVVAPGVALLTASRPRRRRRARVRHRQRLERGGGGGRRPVPRCSRRQGPTWTRGACGARSSAAPATAGGARGSISVPLPRSRRSPSRPRCRSATRTPRLAGHGPVHGPKRFRASAERQRLDGGARRGRRSGAGGLPGAVSAPAS